MKRLVLFISIFGAGLLILVFALGPSRLWRRVATSSIQPQDLPPAPDAISLSSQGQRFKFGMRGAGTIPFWTPVLQPDGATLRVKSAQLKYSDNEPYAGGVHLNTPVLELYPAKGPDENALARVNAAGGDLETQGDLRNLAESLKQQQLKKFSLFPDVRLAWLDPEGRPGMTIETSQLDIPETPAAPDSTAAEDEKRQPFPKLVAPNPVHIFAADGGFDLKAAALELERLDGRLELRGPLTLNATHFALPVAGAATAAHPADDAAQRPPVTLTCDGRATFVRREPAAPPKSDAKAATRDPSQMIGPGTLIFERNVVVSQNDAITHEVRKLRTDWLKLELDHDANGELTVTRFDAGSPQGGVTFELLGGEGSAQHLSRQDDELVATGPVHLDRMRVGRGSEARVFSIAAQDRLSVKQETATGDGPPRWRAELFGAAHATAQDELDGDADHLTAVLVKVADETAPSGDSSFDVDQLRLDGHARLDMHARGKASANQITLGARGRGGRTAHLEGDAVATTDRGTLRGPTLDLDLPASKELPLHVTAPLLTDGRMALPAGASLLDSAEAKPDAPDAKQKPPRELRLAPLGAAQLKIVGEELHITGRTTVRVFELPADGGERETQRLTADSLDLVPQTGAGAKAGAPPELVADGDVEVVDLERQFHLHGSHAHTELAADGRRHLLMDGAPAKGTIEAALAHWPKGRTAEIALESTRLDFDLVTRRVVADDQEHLVTAWIPEELFGTVLPSGFGVLARKAGDAAAALPPVEFHAEHVDVTPQEQEATHRPAKLPAALAATATSDNPFARALVTAHGRIHALRKSDGSTFDAQTMVLDLAISRARLDGAPGKPVLLKRPKAYAKDRVEQIVSDWIEAVDGGQKVTLAPRRDEPLIILFPEHETEDGKLPQRKRVALRCSNPPELVGNRLLLTGGVDTDLEVGDPKEPDFETAHSHSERVEILLSGALGDPDLTLVRLNAQERVKLDFADFKAEGARLTYEFTTGELVLKQGLEPCRLLAADARGDWYTTATFELMTANLPVEGQDHVKSGRSRTNLLAMEFPKVRFKNFQLVAEGPRER